MLAEHIFREYDIRGIVAQDIDAHGAVALGKSFASHVQDTIQGKTIVLGYDGRLSSPLLAHNLTKGMIDAGADVIDIGCGPTPMLYFASHFFAADGAIMVTGSHNAAQFNGFKMVIGQKAIFGQEIRSLLHRIKQQKFTQAPGTYVKKTILNNYVNYLWKDFTNHYDKNNLRIAWDPGNGAAGEVLKMLTLKLSGENYLINAKIDGCFPAHHPDPTVPENLIQLQETVQKHNCDLGIAFDGDGDRIVVIDSEGNILFGDQLMYLFSSEVLAHNPQATIIADVKSSQHLFDYIAEKGGKPLMWKTGHSHIKHKMREVGCLLGGEMSGHIFFNDRYYGFDDAIYAALRLIGYLNKAKINITHWFKNFALTYNTPEIKVPCTQINKFLIIEKIKQQLINDNIKFNDIDGVRINTPEGWWLIRASNTEEIIVIRAEAASKHELTNMLRNIEKYLQNIGIKCSMLLK